MHHEVVLPVQPNAPGLARRDLDGWLSATIGESPAEKVRLAASELVTNVIHHAGLEADPAIRLTIDVDAHAVRVNVQQPTGASAAAVVPASDRSPDGGYGLAIVEDITDRWGIEPGPPGAVWFEVRRSDA